MISKSYFQIQVGEGWTSNWHRSFPSYCTTHMQRYWSERQSASREGCAQLAHVFWGTVVSGMIAGPCPGFFALLAVKFPRDR